MRKWAMIVLCCFLFTNLHAEDLDEINNGNPHFKYWTSLCALASRLAYLPGKDGHTEHQSFLEQIKEFGFEHFGTSTDDEGFQAYSFKNEPLKTIIVAFRGTVSNKQDILADFEIAQSASEEESVDPGISEKISNFASFCFNTYDTFKGASSIHDGIVSIITQAMHKEEISQTYLNALSAFYFLNNLNVVGKKIDNASQKTLYTFALKSLEFFDGSALEGYKVIVTGHSMGGFLASLVGIMRQKTALTFNAPDGYKKFLEEWGTELSKKTSYDDLPFRWFSKFKKFKTPDPSVNYNVTRKSDVVGHLGDNALRQQVTISDYTNAEKEVDTLVNEIKTIILANHSMPKLVVSLAPHISSSKALENPDIELIQYAAPPTESCASTRLMASAKPMHMRAQEYR